MKDQNELQAMNKDPPKHTLVWVHFLLSTEMKDRAYVQDLDMLSDYGQDDLVRLVFAVEEMLVELDSQNHFVHEALECQ